MTPRPRYAYDPYTAGRTLEQRPDGASLRRTFDATGNLTSTTDPEGRVHSYTYDGLGNRTSTTYPSGRRDVAQYDSRGNLVAVTEDAGRTALTTAFSRDGEGDLTQSVSPGGAVSRYETDAAGLLLAVIDPDGLQVRLTYDELGRETSRVMEADPSAPVAPGTRRTSTTYDERSRVLTQTDPLGGVTTHDYDAVGRLASVVGPRQERVDHEYDAAGNRVETRVGEDVVTFDYDDMGRVVRQVDPDQGVTRWAYDALGRRTSTTDPADRTTQVNYDQAGRLRTSTRPTGVSVTNTYDDSGLLLAKDYGDQTHDVTFAYDGDGRRAAMTDGTGTTAWTYDTAGRLTKVVDGAGATVGYQLDRDGNVVSLTYPIGRSVERRYSPAGRLTAVTDWLGGTTSFSPDAFGQRSWVTYPNGVTGAWTYDAAGAPTRASWTHGAAPVADFATPTADGAGLVTTEASSGPGPLSRSYGYGYGYDDPNRLSGVDGKDVQYDFAANLLQSADGVSQRFDTAGQLVSRTAAGVGEASGTPVEVRGTRTATADPSQQVLRLTDVDALAGDTVVLLLSAGAGKRGPGTSPRAVAGGLRFERLGQVTTSSGEAEAWVARVPEPTRTTVVVPLGGRHGTAMASAVTVAGVRDVELSTADGRGSSASSSVATSAGDLVLRATAARSGTPGTPTAVQPGTVLAAGTDGQSGFLGLLSSARAERPGEVLVGMARAADEWALASVRLRGDAQGEARTSTFTPAPTARGSRSSWALRPAGATDEEDD